MPSFHIFFFPASLALLAADAAFLRAGIQGQLDEVAAANVSKPRKKGKSTGAWYVTKYGSGDSCDKFCSSKKAVCDFTGAKVNKRKIKGAAKAVKLQCSKVKSGTDKGAPYLELENKGSKTGVCVAPESEKSLDCSVKTATGTRRLCYCVAKSDASPSGRYEPIWQRPWVWPVNVRDDWKMEICQCYAKKGEHGGDAVPDTLMHHDHLDDAGYDGACAHYCASSPAGAFHAADLHLLADWSTKRPAIVVVHGLGGSKDDKSVEYVGKQFRDAGFIVMSVAYTARTCTEDVSNAVDFLKTHADEYGILAESIAIYGYSLGAQCAVRAGFKNAALPNQNVKAVIDMSGRESGYMNAPLIDSAWPECKRTRSNIELGTAKCGGVYEDAGKLGASCDYPWCGRW